MFRQYTLRRFGVRRVGWIDHEPRLKPGTIVTLKGEDTWWAVELAGTVTLDAAPSTEWQVGGLVGRLALPRTH